VNKTREVRESRIVTKQFSGVSLRCQMSGFKSSVSEIFCFAAICLIPDACSLIALHYSILALHQHSHYSPLILIVDPELPRPASVFSSSLIRSRGPFFRLNISRPSDSMASGAEEC